MKKVLILLLFLSAFVIAGCESDEEVDEIQPTLSEIELCEAEGGELIACYTVSGYACSVPTSDAGKQCQSSADCEEQCVAPDNCNENTEYGTCADRSHLVCNGVSLFENGCAGTIIT